MKANRLILLVCVAALMSWSAAAQAIPPGANDPACAPNALLHPHPLGTPSTHGHPAVILVHGTAVTSDTMAFLAAALRASGYCPWAMNYPTDMGSDTAAPDTLKGFVDDVLADTDNGYDTGQVSMVGHSQGGMQIRHMLKHYSSAPVQDAISLAGSQKGSAHPGAPACTDFHLCPAGFEEQVAGSDFYDHLNGGCNDFGLLEDFDCAVPTFGSADYTQIATVTDELMQPYWRALIGPDPILAPGFNDPQVSDVVLQTWCPGAAADHLTIASDVNVFRLILDALARSGPADASVPCASSPF